LSSFVRTWFSKIIKEFSNQEKTRAICGASV